MKQYENDKRIITSSRYTYDFKILCKLELQSKVVFKV